MTSAHCGSNSRSQSIARSKRLIRWNGCSRRRRRSRSCAAGAERDQPDPVAGSHQVDRAEPAAARRHARLSTPDRRPVVDSHARADAAPGGVGAVRAGRASPSCRFSRPARPLASTTQRAVTVARVPSAVSVTRWPCLAERDRAHAAAVEHRRARVRVRCSRKFSNRPRSSWNDGTGGNSRRAELDAPREVAVVAVREEVAKAELLELRAAQVRLEVEPLLKVVRADLDARFADLERGFAHRMLPLLGDEHANRGRLQMQLPRQAPPARPPPRMTTSYALGR